MNIEFNSDNKKYLQFISDIHLEFRKNKYPKFEPIIPGKSYLALLGDIGHPSMNNYREFIDHHSKLFVHILIISGNHEYYTSKNKQYTIKDIEQQIQNITDQYINVTYLQKSSIMIGNTLFLGCTLWSEIENCNLVEDSMNDYNNIYVSNINIERSTKTYASKSNYNENFAGQKRKSIIKAGREKLKVYHVLSNYENMKNWIFDTIDINKNINIIVLTHHAPTYEMVEDKDTNLIQCYASHLDDYIKKYNMINYWLSGHTHICKEIRIGFTTCTSNCLGRPNEKITGFDPNKYITFI